MPFETEQISSFFLPIKEKIIHSLSQRHVLESLNEQLATPPTLFYVPKEYRDDRGIPLTSSPMTAPKYLSPQYPESEREVLRQLGVRTLTADDFLMDLKAIIELDPSTFHAKPGTWHTQLAKVLLSLLVKDKLKVWIETMRIIPLRDGQWVAAADNSIFFSAKTQGLHIPEGLPILLVDRSVEFDIHRRNLFQQLGVRDCDALGICRLISAMHNRKDFVPSTLTRKQLVQHARFLYRASWRPAQGSELWFATKRDHRCRGSQLYIRMDCPVYSPAARIYDKLEANFNFIHNDYLNVFSTDRTPWIAWLLKTFSISPIPRLVTTLPRGVSSGNSSISPEFQVLLSDRHLGDLLWTLRENWQYYSQWLENDNGGWQSNSSGAIESSLKDTVREELKSRRLRCKNGLIRLSQAVLPMIDPILDHTAQIPTVDILDPKNPNWRILSNLGVAVEKNASYYVRCLEALRRSRAQRDTLNHVYEQLKNCYVHEGDFIR